jgi:D-alanyl-D-alanine carboxypeptidase/D-alanyl-D-alanine-endopeptidase (penicillin-binding protein 4)
MIAPPTNRIPLACMRRRLIAFAIFLATLWVTPAFAEPQATPDAKAVQAAGFEPDDIGFVLIDLDDGRALAEQTADALFIPASVAKLATVYPAEQLLGSDFRFQTRLYRAGNALYLKGGGDPVLTNIELRDLARQIETLKPTGGWKGFFYDASGVGSAPEVSGDQPIQATYNAGVGALSVDFNRVQVNWSRDEAGKLTFHARAVADGLNVPADWVRFLPAGSEPPPGANFLYAGDASGESWLYAPDLPGTLPEEGAIFLPVKQPALNTAQVFRELAKRNGIALPEPQAGAVPSDATLVGTVESPPLADVMTGLLKFSNNMTAELIGLATSRRLTSKTLDPRASSAALGEWLRQRLSYVDWTGFKLVNHSGLSSESRASPRQIAAILMAMAREPVLAGMPNRIMGDDPKAAAAAKSGTMDFACGLAGYLTGKSGKRLAFAIFVLDREKRAALDASFDRRVLAPTPGARNWLGRAHALENTLLKGWRERF